MKLTALILSTCFCMVITKTTLAQNDYIVTLKNDTLKGEITKSFFGNHRFKQQDQSKRITITEKNTKRYYISSDKEKPQTFEARVLPKKSKPVFLELHEQGEIQLYELINNAPTQNGGSITTTSWYASKGNGPLFSIKTSGLSFSRADKENSFEQLLGDNTSLWANFKAEKSFSFKVLRKYINLYNQEKLKTTTSK
jgi:hypothetical protein